MRNSAFVIFEGNEKRAEKKKREENAGEWGTELEIPLDITADELIRGVNCGFGLQMDPADLQNWYLTAEYPSKLIRGDKILAELGIRDGTVIRCHKRRVRRSAGEQVLKTFQARPRFELMGGDHDQEIDLEGFHEFTIGANQNNTIQISDNRLEQDEIHLIKLSGDEKAEYLLDVSHTAYGIELNGFPVLPDERNGRVCTGDFLNLRGYEFILQEDRIRTSIRTILKTACKTRNLSQRENALQYPEFVRSARQLFVIPKDSPEVRAPKEKEKNEQQNVLISLLPALLNLVLMTGIRGTMGMSPLYSLALGATMLVSTSTSVFHERNVRKKQREKEKIRVQKYKQYLKRCCEYLDEIRDEEQKISNLQNPSVEEYLEMIRTFGNRLFEKQKDAEDFLQIRLGTGSIRTERGVQYQKESYVETEDELCGEPEKIHDQYEWLSGMPVTISLKGRDAIGFIGSRTKLYQILKNLLISYGASHYFSEVKFFLILNDQDIRYFFWAGWLKHTWNEGNGGDSNNGCGFRNIVYDEESQKRGMDFLYTELSHRKEMPENLIRSLPEYLVFVYRSDAFRKHPVVKFVKGAASLGFHFLFFEEAEEQVAAEVTDRIFLNGEDQTGYVQKIADGKQIQTFSYPHISSGMAARAAHRLMPVRERELSLESTLTDRVTLYEMLDLIQLSSADIRENWKQNRADQSMAVPIGVMPGGEKMMLDLHEKKDGPHGLVAGTTGSGKSEFLQTLILSLAMHYAPGEVGFILIDFKGGGMANQFRCLPHLLGCVTNMDEKEIDRSLLLLRSELQKRQKLFTEAGVNHIDEYMKKWREGCAPSPLPHLILIVDEFAELKSLQPDFMKELISTSRIGRSLGIHLILATQKPAGVVNDQIWSNARFRICLKVQTAQDSQEILKSPLAAEIKEPGRAYLQIGNHERFELFQSAYSGAPVSSDNSRSRRGFILYERKLSGQRRVLYREAAGLDVQNQITELQSVVHQLSEFAQTEHCIKPSAIFLPPLPEVLNYPEERKKQEGKRTGLVVPVGMVDDPENQRQYEWKLDLQKENIWIVGSALSGKTNILQTILRGAAERYLPEEISFYLLDFASLQLIHFRNLKHVGGIISRNDPEILKNLIKMLREEREKRRNLLSTLGVRSISEIKEIKKDLGINSKIPQIVVMIDQYPVFKNIFPEYEEEMAGMFGDSLSLGISFVITSSRTAGIGYKVLSEFSNRIALYCNDSSEWSVIFEGCRKKPVNQPGRGLVERDRHLYDCQFYRNVSDEDDGDQRQSLQAVIQKINGKAKGSGAIQIPCVPEKISEEILWRQHEGFMQKFDQENGLLTGISYEKVEPEWIDFHEWPLIAVTGEKTKGRFLYTEYVRGHLSGMHRCQLLEPETAKELQNFMGQGWQAEGKYTLRIIWIRQQRMLEEWTELEENMAEIRRQLENFEEYRTVYFLENADNRQVSYRSSDIMKEIRNREKIIYFGRLSRLKLLDGSFTGIRRDEAVREDDGYLLRDGQSERFKIIQKN